MLLHSVYNFGLSECKNGSSLKNLLLKKHILRKVLLYLSEVVSFANGRKHVSKHLTLPTMKVKSIAADKREYLVIIRDNFC